MTKTIIRIGTDAPHMPDTECEASSKFLESFKKNFKIKIQSLDEESMVFDMVGIDASIANAFRRILLAEVPTMAIEHVYIWNNSSIIQDEVLAHRLGLIPLMVDPRDFQSFPEHEEAEATDENTLVFKLDVVCEASKEDPSDISKATNASVYSRHLEWIPQGMQEERFGNIRPVSEDILIAKLRPGQCIALEAHCRKGVGKDHAKFSPVATASYRLLPDIQFPAPLKGADAKTLQKTCPMNVFDIEDSAAIVARPRDCTMCRECIRAPGWDAKVKLGRVSDHFIYSVETVGMLKPEELLPEALKVLMAKCDVAVDSLNAVDDELSQDVEMEDDADEDE
ncbi:hypothetical protein SPRG_09634 [Saprolegnia parasitica CBS 223.65]|uniref:DNA-directed RNA polymerases I and III subunit RPAC1 n=1 Tax=Saprolegnia parasitica (strain CBS 223.65) TaxID=695850 RepID=A0A067CE21_SAPPC|nr:hypothetical protein SPRG_09634 [Saprolegnia parasitica CBS 223.65]KDO24786.1 hypothetical protein SPRG_09634 [Saprolegnia parasitica CBS 223.65]|eukprot:XP_012204450.1 hypothetical protein SPRG_09634 [Saprolegnia parasitica CBS 223.65]